MGTFVAVDAQNLYYSARRAGGKVDYHKLWNQIQREEPDSFTIAYVVRSKTFDSTGFESFLRGVGYRISARQAEMVEADGKAKLKFGSHEVRIALDAAVRYYPDYEKFVLVTGDADYSDLFEHLKGAGRETEIWSYSRTFNPSYLNHVDKVKFLGPDLLVEE